MKLRLDVGMPSHPKVRALAALLGDKNAGMYVIRLWAWALGRSWKVWRGGRLDGFAADELAAVMEWEGPPRALIRALVRVRLLDNAPLRIHGWKDHGKLDRQRHDYLATKLRVLRNFKKRPPSWGGVPKVVLPSVSAAAAEDKKRDENEIDLKLISRSISSYPRAGARAGGRVRRARAGSESGSGSGSLSGSGSQRGSAPPPSDPDPERSGEGGGGLPYGLEAAEWDRIWEALPNRRAYWRERARAAFAALALEPGEVADLVAWIYRKRASSWKTSPPTPLSVAADYGEQLAGKRRRAADDLQLRNRQPPPGLRRVTDGDAEEADRMRATWPEAAKPKGAN